MAIEADLNALAIKLGKLLKERELNICLAESCTGGLCAEIITRVAGCSDWFECGFITYSNQSKKILLNVAEQTLNTHGAVSEETAIEMATGAMNKSATSLSASVTGIAGPTGGSDAKPVGTVCFAWVGLGKALSSTLHFEGNRLDIRQQSAKTLIEGLIALSLSVD